MKWPETVNNLFGALVFGLLFGIIYTYYTRGDFVGWVQVAAQSSFIFIACVGVHWAMVNVAWEIRSRRGKRNLKG